MPLKKKNGRGKLFLCVTCRIHKPAEEYGFAALRFYVHWTDVKVKRRWCVSSAADYSPPLFLPPRSDQWSDTCVCVCELEKCMWTVSAAFSCSKLTKDCHRGAPRVCPGLLISHEHPPTALESPACFSLDKAGNEWDMEGERPALPIW